MSYQPKHAYIIITQNCNLKCPHCFIHHKDNLMSLDLVDTLINTYPSIQCLTLFGGQPLLQDNYDININIIKLCESKNIQVSITSNLAFTLSDRQLQILNKLKYISTSWNYNRFSVKQFQIWKSNLQYLSYLNNDITCLITLTEDLIINLQPMRAYQLFESFNVKYIKFQPYIGIKSISNKLIDKWLMQFYNLNINTEKYIFFKYIEQSFILQSPSNIFNRNCSKNIITLYPNGKTILCPNHYLTPKQIFKLDQLNKNYQYKCLICEYKNICSGSCILLSKQQNYCNGYPLLFKQIKEKMFS